jgi:thymidine kinase
MTKGEKMLHKHGYLGLYLGPMFSGKTSKLMDLYKQFKFCNISVAVINHSADTRYHETMLSNHDNIMIPCIQTTRLMDVWNYTLLDDSYGTIAENHMLMRSASVVLINEAQFFDDLVECVNSMLKENKTIYVFGLDGDFKRNKFGGVLDLIPMCDNVTKLTSFCSLCKDGTPGIFSLRLSDEKEQMLIGSDNYVPVCRGCYKD